MFVARFSDWHETNRTIMQLWGCSSDTIPVAQWCPFFLSFEGFPFKLKQQNKGAPFFPWKSTGHLSSMPLVGPKSSYAQVWMHAMGGREGVIDTACKTSETG